jgi:predicted ATP-dependent endonuclease of OLD family
VAHIVEFSIDGLAGRTEAIHHKLNTDINVFFGLNGSGKTSLLRILGSALSQRADALATVPFKSARVCIYSIDNDREIVYTIKRPEHPRTPTIDEQVFILPDGTAARIQDAGYLGPRRAGELKWQMHGPPLKGKAKHWRHEFLPTSRLIFGHDSGQFRLPSGEIDDVKLDVAFATRLEHEWLQFFGAVKAQETQIQQRGLADILNDVLMTAPSTVEPAALDPDAAYQRMMTFMRRTMPSTKPGSLRNFKQRLEANPSLRRVLSHIDRVEQEIDKIMMPTNKLESLLGKMFGGSGKRLKLDSNAIRITSTRADNISLASLSSGEKHVLRMLITALRAGAGPLIIDEPELSLHIDWQRELVAAIGQLSSKAQLIVATHSPEIMADVQDEKIFRL